MSKLLKAMYLLALHAFLRVRLNNIKFGFDASLIPTAVEIHMSQFKHSYGKHTPILHVQENKLQKDLCPVKALWDYLQLRTVKDIGSFKPLFSFMDELPLSRRFFTSQWRF